MSFAKDFERFAKMTNASLDETGRTIALDLFTAIQKDTPVKSGRARGSWQTTMGTPASGDPIRTLSDAKAELDSTVQSFKMGRVIYLTSNLVYIGKLEFGLYNGGGPNTTTDGFSIQAPAGMARVNAARIQSMVRKAVSENKV